MPVTPPVRPGTGHSERTFPSSRSPSSVRSYDLLTAASQSRQPSPGPQAYTLDQYIAASMQSLHAEHPGAVTAHNANKRLRSQYPAESDQSHVEFILVASFDIDRGSVMEHQYPGPISGDETMLAELMLPDQVHNRTQDWTIFFLHKDNTADEDPEDPDNVEGQGKRRRRRRAHQGENGQYEEQRDGEESVGGSSLEDEEDDEMEGPPLIYVLNLVNTKHDSTAKRGAVVKAMAVCTRHPFLHIYKPLLLLALEEYFRNPVPDTLASLYNSVNSMDLSLIPRLSLLERSILQSSSVKDLFIEKFERMIEQKKQEDSAQGTDSPRKSPRDPSNPPPSKYTLPRDTHEFETKIVYNSISVPVKIPTARSPETVGDFSIIKLIQTFSAPHNSNPQPFAVHPHLTTNGAYTHPIVVLVNALLTQKRIIFLGHNLPSGEVAEAVLAACALASGGILRGFTRHAFPYTDLTKIDDLLRVPGFIAGVTNPAFANKPEWWDILCDLPSGRIKISSSIDPPQMNEGLLSFQAQNPTFAAMTNPSSSNSASQAPSQDATGDTAFMESIQRAISSRLGESIIRAMWRDWTIKLTRIAAAYEEAVYGASALYIGTADADAGAFGVRGHGYVWSDEGARQRELAANAHRIEGWRVTRSYFALVQDQAFIYDTARPVPGIDLAHQHDRLRTQKLRSDDAAAIILALEAAVHTPQEICQLLTVTPESHGGIFYISLGLLHQRQDVRYKTVALLERIVIHEAGKHFWGMLSKFAKLAFFRIKRDMEAGAKGEDGGADARPGAKEIAAS